MLFKLIILGWLLVSLGFQIGQAQGYGSWNITSLGNYSGGLANLWGYSQNGREYALIVRRIIGVDTFKVVDITEPSQPLLVSAFPGLGRAMQEVETYKHFAFVCENSGGAPIQIFDLSFLPDSLKKVADYIPSSGSGCHTIHIQGDYCYCNEGDLLILDIRNPATPVELATIITPGYAHDSYVWKDTLFIGDMSNGILIYDIQDKTNPKLLKHFSYSNSVTHTVWTTEDGKNLLTCDEDIGGHLKIWDIEKLDSIKLVSEYKTNSSAIIHNVYVEGDLAYIAYYSDGLRILDITDPAHPEEAGYFDTSPYDVADYEGAWGAYPYLPSGNILVSDISTGLWILRITGGDYDKDGSITFLDVVFLVNYVFKNGPAPKPKEAGDVNSDCKVNLGDIVYLINYLVRDGPLPTPACFE